MADEKKVEKQQYAPPDLRAFVASESLYASIQLRLQPVHVYVEGQQKLPINMPALSFLVYPAFPVDAYCPGCKQSTIYNADEPGKDARTNLPTLFLTGGTRQFEITMHCSRQRAHELVVIIRTCVWAQDHRTPAMQDRTAHVTKIGMYPSLADLQQPLSARLVKVLGAKGHDEFRRAAGLASHGIGIGAFVYLRRIFEDLIDEVATKVITSGEVKQEDYDRSRMDEKIGLLKNRLPKFMVDHKQWYGIVSKGIHELAEDECLEYFPVIRDGILIILDQKAEAIERAEREKETARAMQGITAKFGTPPET